MKVDLRNEPSPLLECWEAIADLRTNIEDGWALIGAQMVRLHGLARGRQPTRQSRDADIVAQVRSPTPVLKQIVSCLEDAGFVADDPSCEGIAHRYRRDLVSIDVLAQEPKPRNLDKLRTVGAARTVVVPGSSAALARSADWSVLLPSGEGQIPCPDLLGALLIKARAVEVDDLPDAQLHDVAFLCSLIEDVAAMDAAISSKQRQWLRRIEKHLGSADATYWRALDEYGSDGHAAFAFLAQAEA